jgi:hypothetical protein
VNRFLFFAKLRENRPVLVMLEVTLAARFDDCTEILRRQDLFSVALYKPKQGDYWMEKTTPLPIGERNPSCAPSDWSERYPLIPAAAQTRRVDSDRWRGGGLRRHRVANFELMHSVEHDRRAFLHAFDLLDLNGRDQRNASARGP